MFYTCATRFDVTGNLENFLRAELLFTCLSLSSPRPTSARRPVTGRDRCAVGPAAPCGSVLILLPPSPRTHAPPQYKPATTPPVVVVIIPIETLVAIGKLAARGSGSVYEVEESEGDARIASQLWAGGPCRGDAGGVRSVGGAEPGGAAAAGRRGWRQRGVPR